MKATSYKISDKLHLVQQTLATEEAPTVVVEQPVDLVVITDCSGSMSYDLPKVREHLRKKLPKLLKEVDTISLIWFSGKSEYGVLLERESVAKLTDLKAVETAIDRWLKPCGLTAFKEPLEEAARLITKIKAPGRATSLFFMSDGCDNQWDSNTILGAVRKLSGLVDSATFVEYGYYADRNLMTKMAEACGGSNIFSADFQSYTPIFDAAMQRKVVGAPKVQIEVGPNLSGFVFAVDSNEIKTFEVTNSQINVPKDLKTVWYLSDKVVGASGASLVSMFEAIASKNAAALNNNIMTAAYVALGLFAQRMDSNSVYALLQATGDVRFISKFANCFGKQKYSDFIDTVTAAAWNPTFRLMEGFDPNKVPAEDAFTILDLLSTLAGDSENKVLLDKPEFKYSRIGRGRIDSDLVLTEAEQEEIKQLTEQMLKVAKDSKKVKELSDRIASISSKTALVFKPSKDGEGYSLASLTYNESRPNISFLVRKEGTVDLTSKLQDQSFQLPSIFPTHVYRNYSVIKDGLVNIETLPVYLTEGTFNFLNMQGVQMVPKDDYHVINLTDIPIINRKMVKTVSAKELFTLEYELAVSKGAQKVFKKYLEEISDKGPSETFVSKYGQEAATWLEQQGFGYNGFAPKSVVAESTDVYLGKELKVSLKGLSSLPTVKEVRETLAKNGKIKPSAALMVPAIKEVEAFKACDGFVEGDAFKAWLEVKVKETVTQTRKLIEDLAKLKFSIVVGQTWPFPSLDETKYSLQLPDGGTLECTIEQKDIEIKI